jgi:hypothetical protein
VSRPGRQAVYMISSTFETDDRVYKLTTEYVGEFSNSTPELMSSMRM